MEQPYQLVVGGFLLSVRSTMIDITLQQLILMRMLSVALLAKQKAMVML
jgi:hypothetical protein